MSRTTHRTAQLCGPGAAQRGQVTTVVATPASIGATLARAVSASPHLRFDGPDAAFSSTPPDEQTTAGGSSPWQALGRPVSLPSAQVAPSHKGGPVRLFLIEN